MIEDIDIRGLENILFRAYVRRGKWSMKFMSEPAKTAEEFRLFGGTLSEMITLSTIENHGQDGKWRIE